MIAGIGTDVIEIDRVRNSLRRFEERFLNRVFTPQEQAYCQVKADPAIHLAGRFAAKEAFLKALGSGLRGELSWLDMGICHNDQGAPFFQLSERLQHRLRKASITRHHVTLSHSHTIASSTVILEHE